MIGKSALGLPSQNIFGRRETTEPTETGMIVEHAAPITGKLIAAREACGMSRKELAQKIGVHPAAVWQWENGKNGIIPPTFEKLCAALDVDKSEFVELKSVDLRRQRAELEGSPDPEAKPEAEPPGRLVLLGQKLKALRQAQDLSQVKLAEKAGVSGQAISAYEAGRYGPSRESLDKLCAALGVALTDLIEAPDAATPPDTARLQEEAETQRKVRPAFSGTEAEKTAALKAKMQKLVAEASVEAAEEVVKPAEEVVEPAAQIVAPPTSQAPPEEQPPLVQTSYGVRLATPAEIAKPDGPNNWRALRKIETARAEREAKEAAKAEHARQQEEARNAKPEPILQRPQPILRALHDLGPAVGLAPQSAANGARTAEARRPPQHEGANGNGHRPASARPEADTQWESRGSAKEAASMAEMSTIAAVIEMARFKISHMAGVRLSKVRLRLEIMSE